jgi:chemotaxis protein histidine kinase CheA
MRLRVPILVSLLALGLLLAAAWLTRGGDPLLEYNAPPQLPNTNGLVDQTPLSTARSLASLAGTPQEREYAQQALRVADHEVDQAFAAALHDAVANPPALSGEALEVSNRLNALKPHVEQEQQQVASLAKAAPANDEAAQQLQLGQAQLALDQDEADDLEQDLIRFGGDRHEKIQQALNEHEELQKKAGTIAEHTANAALETEDGLRSFIGKMKAWLSLRSRAAQLEQAQSAAVSAAQALSARHDALNAAARTNTIAHPSAAQAAQSNTNVEAAGALSQLHALADQRRTLAQIDSRAHDEQQLGQIYDRWYRLVRLDQRTVLHRLLVATIAVGCLVMLMLAAHLTAIHLLEARVADRRRRNHLRVLWEIAIQGTGILLILLVLFGPPQQLSALVGLGTAAIAFVMKDFVVAFFGWFVLMGRSGLRVGDWVEINGVNGEVAEIGILRTTLLETEAGADTGHPTGRRVTFMNSYAIEGHFFNFSSAGQWLWDELTVNIAEVEAAVEKAEQIRVAVDEDTRANAAHAEREWKHAAKPTVSLRPAAAGIDVIVHYVAQASERYETRSRLYHKSLELLHFTKSAAG